jgi:hypothetical protein
VSPWVAGATFALIVTVFRTYLNRSPGDARNSVVNPPLCWIVSRITTSLTFTPGRSSRSPVTATGWPAERFRTMRSSVTWCCSGVPLPSGASIGSWTRISRSLWTCAVVLRTVKLSLLSVLLSPRDVPVSAAASFRPVVFALRLNPACEASAAARSRNTVNCLVGSSNTTHPLPVSPATDRSRKQSASS